MVARSYTNRLGVAPPMPESTLHGTTILAVRHRGGLALAGDGKVTLGQTVVKHKARKIQRLHGGAVLAGFAGSTADAMALIHKFEARLEEYRGNLQRAAVELAKEWRTDRTLRPGRGPRPRSPLRPGRRRRRARGHAHRVRDLHLHERRGRGGDPLGMA